MCFQAPWSRAPSCSSAGPACPRPAPTAAPSACGTSSGTTLARTSPKSPCPCSSTSRLTHCRGCVRSWSTASCSTGPPTRRTPLNAWWGGVRGSSGRAANVQFCVINLRKQSGKRSFFICRDKSIYHFLICRQRGKFKLVRYVSWRVKHEEVAQ